MYSGIYCYKDIKNDNEIIYIGKDTRINKNKRYKDHMYPSNYKYQKINQVLQNNPSRYKYEVIKSWKTDEYHPNLSNVLEILYIKKYNPKFNFTKGGEGVLGYKPSKETIEKQRKKVKGFKHTEEAKRKIGLASKGRKVSDETRKKMSESTKRYMSIPEHREYISKCMQGSNNHQWKDYPRIIKDGYKRGKQNYAIKYNGKRIYSSVNYENILKKFEELNFKINEKRL